MKKKMNYIHIFIIIVGFVLLTNITAIIITTSMNIEARLFDALDIASLILSFSGFAISFFFSLAVYIQAKNQGDINETLLRKDDQYIVSNYSLVSFNKEITFLEPKHHISEQALFNVNEDGNTIWQIVFLVTDYINKPIYKVYCKELIFETPMRRKVISPAMDYDCKYASNILNRGYNCFTINLKTTKEQLEQYIKEEGKISLTLLVESIFNVVFEMKYEVFLDSKKDLSDNLDRFIYPEMFTYNIHHANYHIVNKFIRGK